jgi:hypothetical protein
MISASPASPYRGQATAVGLVAARVAAPPQAGTNRIATRADLQVCDFVREKTMAGEGMGSVAPGSSADARAGTYRIAVGRSASGFVLTADTPIKARQFGREPLAQT